jgi:hypothetical protein
MIAKTTATDNCCDDNEDTAVAPDDNTDDVDVEYLDVYTAYTL